MILILDLFTYLLMTQIQFLNMLNVEYDDLQHFKFCKANHNEFEKDVSTSDIVLVK